MAAIVQQKSILRTTRENLHAVEQRFAPAIEYIWFLVAFGLFVILGPFAAPAAIIVLFTMDDDQRGSNEPELFVE